MVLKGIEDLKPTNKDKATVVATFDMPEQQSELQVTYEAMATDASTWTCTSRRATRRCPRCLASACA